MEFKNEKKVMEQYMPRFSRKQVKQGCPQSIYDKIWNAHIVHEAVGQDVILYIDRHYLHEVSSHPAFAGLRAAGRSVRRPEMTFATMDHNVPTKERHKPIQDILSIKQIETLIRNCRDFNITCFDVSHPYNGVIHVTGPELGLTLPGMTVVCGDSHTSTHGALGALAQGIGSSEVEHVLTTQTLRQEKSPTMEIHLTGHMPHRVSSKDVILAIIGRIGIGGATGHVVEYTGNAVREMTIEQRFTICNMTIEAGARAGLVSPDETTIAFLKGRTFLPKDVSWDELAEDWRSWRSDPECTYDRSMTMTMDVSTVEPQVTWGTSPAMVTGIGGNTPNLEDLEDEDVRNASSAALTYMGLDERQPVKDIQPDVVFIGSCTNGRIEDLRLAAEILRGYRIHSRIQQALVVPGSNLVKRQAEEEGIAKVFIKAGFEWREPGCSMCLAMNPDVLPAGLRSASTTNRNFEGRQGKGSRTHLVSPAMAAAAAVKGHFFDVRKWETR